VQNSAGLGTLPRKIPTYETKNVKSHFFRQ
jgi:hypothetical protein